ncbi:hypothetical protein RRG08_053499, partial [Elysia crispata]
WSVNDQSHKALSFHANCYARSGKVRSGGFSVTYEEQQKNSRDTSSLTLGLQ